MTISCQSWGQEWGTPGFERELQELHKLGVNWIATHPYARIHGNGTVSWRPVDPEQTPDWLAGPVRDAHALGMQIMVKPHLAYWGSPFAWRGEIQFAQPEAKARFWKSYCEWILTLAAATRGADAFVIGTELDLLLGEEDQWRQLIADLRKVTGAKLTYAANWTDFERVTFWDDLDAIGVQAYFPLVESELPVVVETVTDPSYSGGAAVEADPTPKIPTEEMLRAGWRRVLVPLRSLHERTGKPVVFTEIGYTRSLLAAEEPWKDEPRNIDLKQAADDLQELCYRVALDVLETEQSWLRGAFLWKWFVGEPRRGDQSFYVDRPALRAILRAHWTG